MPFQQILSRLDLIFSSFFFAFPFFLFLRFLSFKERANRVSKKIRNISNFFLVSMYDQVKQDETTPAWIILELVAQPVILHTRVEQAFSLKYRHDLANGEQKFSARFERKIILLFHFLLKVFFFGFKFFFSIWCQNLHD